SVSGAHIRRPTLGADFRAVLPLARESIWARSMFGDRAPWLWEVDDFSVVKPEGSPSPTVRCLRRFQDCWVLHFLQHRTTKSTWMDYNRATCPPISGRGRSLLQSSRFP